MDKFLTLLSWGPEGWLDDIAHGVLITILLTAATLPIGLAIGFFVALAKQSKEPTLRLAGNIYTTIFRGLPELVTLFLAGPDQVTLPRQMFTGIRENISPTIAAVATLLIVFTTTLLLALEWLRGRRR
jgi:His/Glu/Gln/Arg/opine family amino acid ABC transporter permease subunit